ncbi:MAG: TatD family hydrolase [Candidatus Competibacteraceae bacterium]|jgi:TatD DNase family protein|nr:TatD family hydrolase [Candidatus Competibacteraceae bacterium]
MELVDIGVNLIHNSFQHDLQNVIQQAKEAGVTQLVITGTSESVSQAALALAQNHPGTLYSTAGVHPHEARHWQTHSATALQTLAAAPEVVALGEMGLDFNRDFSPRSDQERAYEVQLELAAEMHMPVFLHEREARQSLVRILSRYRDQLPAAVVHCFTGNVDDLAAYREMDLHIGITGWICDERRGLHLQQLVRQIPLNRLMLETDAPYLLPRDLRPAPKGRRNEPAFLPHVLTKVAHCLGLSAEELAATTTETARTFFNITQPPDAETAR